MGRTSNSSSDGCDEATLRRYRRSCREPVCEAADEGIARIEFRLRHELVGLVRLRNRARTADDRGPASW